MLVNIIIVFGTFIFMEGVAWFTHKYIMHGILWTWHKSHHKKHDHILELNDLFAVVFSEACFGGFRCSVAGVGFAGVAAAGSILSRSRLDFTVRSNPIS